MMKKSKLFFVAGIVLLALGFTSCDKTCGIVLRDKAETFTIFEKGSVAQQI